MDEKIPLKVLDDILKFLFKSDDHKALKKEVKNFIESNNFIFRSKSNSTLDEIAGNTFDRRDSLILFNQRTDEAILYLSKNNFVRLNGEELSLTYDGIMQYSKGYISTYNYEKSIQNRLDAFDEFQRSSSKRMLWVNVFIAIGTLVAAVYYILEMIPIPIAFVNKN